MSTTHLGIITILIVSFLIGSTGCAYRAGAGDRQIPGGYRAVAVPVFKNSTHEAGIEVYFTNALVRELERSGVGKVTDKSTAQVTLEGIINEVNYSRTQVQEGGDNLPLPTNTVLATIYTITVTTTMRLRRNSDQRVLWEGSFQKAQTYNTPTIGRPQPLSSANALYNHSARYQNIQGMAAEMMAEAHDRLTENF